MKDKNRKFKRYKESIGIPERRPILILCEGRVTEPNYFRKFKDSEYFNEDKIQLDIKGKTGRKNIDNAITSSIKDKYDYIWYVIDFEKRDKEHIESIEKVIEYADKNDKLSICLSIPCFEVWILAHFRNTHKEFENCSAVIKEVKRHWEKKFKQKYDKADKEIFTKIKGCTNKAIENAKCVFENRHLDRDKIYEYNSSTEVYKLIEQIIEKSK
jgi:RloB-like protein